MWKKDLNVQRYSAGTFKKLSEQVLCEYPFQLLLNGKNLYSSLSIPSRHKELAWGYLYLHRIIRRIDDIAELEQEGDTVSVKVSHSANTATESDAHTHATPSTVAPATILSLMSEFQEQALLYKRTGIAQTVGLLSSNEVLCTAEDLNLFNALCKVIGYALNKNLGIKGRMIFFSGRICSELMNACADLGISTVVSRTGLTDKAITIADAHNMSALGFTRTREFTQFSGDSIISV